MIIALDYDGTYTADIPLWNMFIKQAKANGHKVIVVTFRYKDEGAPVEHDLRGVVDEIYYTGRHPKLAYMEDQGISPNIWIDDQPYFIFQGMTPYVPNKPASDGVIILPSKSL